MQPKSLGDVDTTNQHASIKSANSPTVNGHKAAAQANGDSNGNGTGHGIGHGMVNGLGNGNAGGTNGTTNPNTNANTIASNNTTTTTNGGYQNGARRDSSQAFTPLLADGTNGGKLTDATTMLYESTPSNNNEWKAAESINNLKNGLLHLAHPAQQQPLHHHHHHNNLHHHHHLHGHQGNNNGTNGHHAHEEQDPLTGRRYKTQQLRASESEESDFDSDLQQHGGDPNKLPTCGLFGCRPRWARRFASTHVFMVVFLLAYILQGMYMTYFVSVITTIEKLFQIKSKTTGFLLSASEMGQISTAMLLTYFAGRGHRPRWIACGMVLFSIAAFSCALPHFIFGKQLMQSSVFLKTPAYMPSGAQLDKSEMLIFDLAASLNESRSGARLTSQPLDVTLCVLGTNASHGSNECDEERKLEQASHSKITVIVLCIFFASLLSSGIGQTAVATLGIPYIDDNVASKQSPMYMAITIGMRILGPASGFIVGSFCTRWYVNFSNPGYDASDPRWIGAWWLGPVAIGSLMLLASIAMFSFPKELRGKRNMNETQTAAVAAEPEEKPKLKDFPKTVRRQLSNDILMFRTASCVFHLLPIAGLYTFLPKYLETQFRLATYDANMIAAFCGILVMGIGIVISGLVIFKLKPSARSVAAWIAFTALVYSAGMVVLMFIGCSMNDFAGYKTSSAHSPALIEPACNAALDCTCDKENFAPICGIDGKIYISACHAGCGSTHVRSGDNRTVYNNCACIPDIVTPTTLPPNTGSSSSNSSSTWSSNTNSPHVAVNGYCDNNCKNFIYFILIFAICVFMHSTSEVGSMLLVMRCTHPKDKAMAMGVIQSAIGLFGNVPCPIIYGAVVDSACLIWKSVCGKHGACSLYDADTFRHYFLGITAGIMFLAFIMDLVVWSKAHRIDIAPGDNQENRANESPECKEAMHASVQPAPDTTV